MEEGTKVEKLDGAASGLSDVLCRDGKNIDADLWREYLHSGSEAIEVARKFLADATCFGQGELGAFQIAQVCTELIYRVTGEFITPKQGFYWSGNRIEGPLFSAMIFHDDPYA